MRKVLSWVAAAIVFCSLCYAQPADQRTQAGTAQATPQNEANMPAAQDPARPQQQMPPDSKAPAPTPSAKTLPNSDVPAPAPTATGPAATVSSGPRLLAKGTDIRAMLDTPLSSKTSRVGDRFSATVSAPVHDAGGVIIVPVGSKLNGQITESGNDQLNNAIKDMGHLNLRFTDIQLAGGAAVPITATLISVHRMKTQPVGPATSAGLPPAPGVNAGIVAFGPPLKGLAVGNLTGGGYVLATTAKQVELPAACGLRLRVDRDTTLQ